MAELVLEIVGRQSLRRRLALRKTFPLKRVEGLRRWRKAWWAPAVLCVSLLIGLRTAAQPAPVLNSRLHSVTNRAAVKPSFSSRYRPPTDSEILSNRLQALGWGELARETISPAVHLIETKNFLVFSAWDSSQDKPLAAICEEMYERIRKQFNIQPAESVWIGKCPVYLFRKTGDFRRFATEVDRGTISNSRAARLDGYHATHGRFSYIVINGIEDLGDSPKEAMTRFYEVLVHEGTHAFLSRFVSNRPISLWVEEGMADYIAANLVPASKANRKYIEGARYALRKPKSLSRLFDKKEFDSTDYGIAQSLVRYLIMLNGNAFVQFVERMKQGTDEETALAECYRMPRDEVVRRWALFWRQYLARSAL